MVTVSPGNPIHKNLLKREVDPFLFSKEKQSIRKINPDKEQKIKELNLLFIKELTEEMSLYDCVDKDDISRYSLLKREHDLRNSNVSRRNIIYAVLPLALFVGYRWFTARVSPVQTLVRDIYFYPLGSFLLMSLNYVVKKSGETDRGYNSFESIFYSMALMHSMTIKAHKNVKFDHLERIYL
jgi:hypothetical protein